MVIYRFIYLFSKCQHLIKQDALNCWLLLAQEQLLQLQQLQEREQELHRLRRQLSTAHAQIEQLQTSSIESRDFAENVMTTQSPEHGERPAAEVRPLVAAILSCVTGVCGVLAKWSLFVDVMAELYFNTVELYTVCHEKDKLGTSRNKWNNCNIVPILEET